MLVNRVLSGRLTSILVLVCGCAMSAAAEPPDKPAPDMLAGPRVRDGGVPGENRRFTDAPPGGKDRVREIPHRLFMHALEPLRTPDAGELRLTPDQDSKIKAASEDFFASRRKFLEDHRDDITSAMKNLTPEDRRRARDLFAPGPEPRRDRPGRGERGGNVPPPPPGRGPDDRHPPDAEGMKPDPQAAESARKQLRDLIEALPKPADAHAKIYAVLSAPQKKAVEENLGKAREEMEKRFGEERARRQVQSKLGKKDAKDAARDSGEEMAPRELWRDLSAQERADLRDKLCDMTPKERREYLKNLREKGSQGKPSEPK